MTVSLPTYPNEDYKPCPFCGNKPEFKYSMSWETGQDDYVEHKLHALPSGLSCPLSGIVFRRTKWQTRWRERK